MPKFRVAGKLIVRFEVDVEAADEGEAEVKVADMGADLQNCAWDEDLDITDVWEVK